MDIRSIIVVWVGLFVMPLVCHAATTEADVKVPAVAGTEVLDQPTDLDLTDVVKAINFGDTTDQEIGGVAFLAAPAISGEPELIRQYEALNRDLSRRSTFDQVADETFRREALILETDRDPTDVVLRRTEALLADIQKMPTVDLSAMAAELKALRAAADTMGVSEVLLRYELFEKVCKLRRRIAFSNPLLKGCDDILFIKRHGSLFSHMADQFYGVTAQPGGGMYVLSDAFGKEPKVRDVLADSVVQSGRLKGQKLSGGRSKRWKLSYDGRGNLFGEETEGGAFLSPDLSFDGKQILFAYTECKGSRDHKTHADHSRGHWDKSRC